MTEEPKDTRPWWRKKTVIGYSLIVIGKIMYAIPAAAPFAPAVDIAGCILAGIGIGHREAKGK